MSTPLLQYDLAQPITIILVGPNYPRWQMVDLSHQYQFIGQLDRLRQEPGQSIDNFYS
ncbi:hypothetical protein CFOL_v3_18224 [Cephalotus follicularis]|uniref:Uncharacterized protein n=1 Tax=Cephalotus follicularis TaxID=3775 RepID=A0A1Q3C3C6_CEPFO|nr:hypothetical protein CFOL_v3_18224 [Cephalotus follicularis]